MILPVRALALGASLLALIVLGAPARAQPARPPLGGRVSVQPINGGRVGGELGPALRGQIARLLRAHRYRAVTTLPRVAGTGQYPELARDNRLTAFVTADLEEGLHSARVTFLVWDGATGSVQGRWSAYAATKRLPKVIAKGFWKALGPRFDSLQPPPSDELAPAAPLYVNAGDPLE
jgi:hypothetical protein